jgi:hypothetical protein
MVGTSTDPLSAPSHVTLEQKQADEIVAIASLGTAFAPVTYVSGFWYLPPHALALGNHGPNTTLVLSPYWFPYGTQIVNLGEWINTAGAASSVRRLGVYADNGSMYPGSLILDAGTAASTATGFTSLTAGPFSALTVSGLVWIGGATQVATGTVVVGTAANVPGISGGSGTPPTGTSHMGGYQETGVTGALPSTFTATRSVSNSAPRTYFKIA